MGAYRSITYASDSKDGDPLSWSGPAPTPVRSYNVPNWVLGVTFPDLLPVSVSPTNSGPSVNGIWTGEVTVHEAVSNLVLRADDSLGHEGESNPFDAQGAAAPLLLQNWHLSAGQFAFDLSGQPGCKLLIQASTDLKHWVTLHGCYLTNSPLGFVDPESQLYPKRLYRLMDAAGVALMEQQGWGSGQFHLKLVGELGRTVVVEASTNLADWPPIATNVLGSDPLLFTDPQSGVCKHRFYHVLMP